MVSNVLRISDSIIKQLPGHSFTAITLGLGALAAVWALFSPKSSSAKLPYPPGPRGYPIIGNILDVPLQYPWVVYKEWAAQHGDIVFIKALNQPILILDSLRRIEDLLEKRSLLYSNRPPMPMLRGLMGWDNMFVAMDYGPRWRLQRKTFAQYFTQSENKKYHPLLRERVQELIERVRLNPNNHDAPTLVTRFTTSVIIKVTYGFDIDDSKVYNETIQGVVDRFQEAALPGRFLVDVMPFLKYVPAWLPGAGFQRFVEERMKRGEASSCMASDMIERLPDHDDPTRSNMERTFREVASLTHIAGVDTVAGALGSFIYAMCIYPEVQRKIQDELDANIVPGHLPSFDNRDQLPYLNAAIKEGLRWITIGSPISDARRGFPHVVAKDDVYDGYIIPKGTVVLGNAWSIHHNPEYYPDPSEFMPERFLDPSKPALDPALVAFGYGRRSCPGVHFAFDVMFIFCSSILTEFEVYSPEPLPKVPDLVDGPKSGVKSFQCNFRPRIC
ncbi:cytochrome P450 [Coprinopsis cinerea okayama7|uniref:Cytochrome P450 n=1 Tax=Coprinopsis cinerea (strain Okayama-7 / 130 / ATCC MYA-4618 / FGSC 9003) TaxID=240176 RepID=A8P3A2_COPC7|nr:cytochrome P450 [Coprinopsis cinerea okayama7\|eukprot:XP_001838505.2 cytochrome P450 [Coprinopsis cinerea okayama7\